MDNGYSFHKIDGRLAIFQSMPEDDRDHWHERWSEQPLPAWLAQYQTGRLDEFEGPFTRYLPRHLPILEAGCGLGHLVSSLHARDYNVEGLDYDSGTVERIRTAAPHLRVRVGDVYSIDAPDGHYGGYISIGVFEHDLSGPLRGLREARRVLHPEGFAFITVPHLNNKRAALLRRTRSGSSPGQSGLRFYQFYFSESEFRKFLVQAGLEVVETVPYALYSGFTRDWALGRWLQKHKFFCYPVERFVPRWCASAPEFFRRRWAHMMMYICRPVATS